MKTSFPPDSPYIDHEDLLTLTEMKENARAMTELGKRIVNLTDRQLRRVPLEEGAVRTAIMEARRLDNFSARKRQLGFLGRLLRAIDVEPLQKALEDIAASIPFVDPKVQAAREWTQRLLDEGRSGISSFLEAAPGAERTRLSHLVRQYAKDMKGITHEQPDYGARDARARGALHRYVQAELTAAQRGVAASVPATTSSVSTAG